MMISMAYENGSIDESVNYMSNKYPYYIVKNMHQLFLQITKEGSRDSGESLENMQLDIDMLVESVYIAILGNPIILIILHGIILINSYFLLKGEKYYNENVGAE